MCASGLQRVGQLRGPFHLQGEQDATYHRNIHFLISKEIIEVVNNLVIRTACVTLDMLKEPTNMHKLFVAGVTSECIVPCVIDARSVTAVDIVTELSLDVIAILAVACLKVD
jgi:hypothetical protein